MIVGAPASVKRTITEQELDEIRHSADHYVRLAQAHAQLQAGAVGRVMGRSSPAHRGREQRLTLPPRPRHCRMKSFQILSRRPDRSSLPPVNRRAPLNLLLLTSLVVALAGRGGEDRIDRLVKILQTSSSYKVRLQAVITLGKLKDRRRSRPRPRALRR